MKKWSTRPVLAVIVAGMALSVSPAAAQTVDELRRQIQVLTERLDAMERRQAEEAEARAAAPVAAAPDQDIITSGNDNIELSISGQVNRGVLFVDNGPSEEFFHVDNDNSSTRVRFIGAGRLTEDVTVGTQIEVQFESNSTAAIRIDQDSPAGPNNFTERKLELFVDSERFGRLWVGQGDTASNGTSEVDLSGTAVVAYSGIQDMAGGIAFADETNALGPRINQAFNQFDGLSRDDRLRYDTPSFMGFTASASAVDGGSWDAALRFAGAIEDVKVAAAAAYANANSRQGFEQYNGSVSVRLPMGLSFTGALGTRDVEGSTEDDPVTYYAKLGYAFDLIDFGKTAVAIDYGRTEDLARDGDEFNTYGAFLVQNFDAVATEFYLGVRNHELDRDGTDFDDILAVIAGGRVKF